MLVAATKFFRLAVQIAILGVGAYLVLQQELTSGASIAGSIIMGRALAPVEQLIGGWKQLVQARQSFRRLHAFLTQPRLRPPGMPLPEPTGRCRVERVSYAFPGQGVALIKGVNFALQPGESLAVIGPSAAGKTTLIRLLIGTLPPSAGTVRLDGADVYQWMREDFGRHVGYLPQDVELFDGTVFANIARMAEADAGGGLRGGQARRLPRDDPAPAERLRHRDRRWRPAPLGRPAPADRPGPGDVRPAQAGGAGRAEQQPGRRLGGGADRGAGAAEGAGHHGGAGLAPADPGAGRRQGAAAEGRRDGDVRPARRGAEAPDEPAAAGRGAAPPPDASAWRGVPPDERDHRRPRPRSPPAAPRGRWRRCRRRDLGRRPAALPADTRCWTRRRRAPAGRWSSACWSSWSSSSASRPGRRWRRWPRPRSRRA